MKPQFDGKNLKAQMKRHTLTFEDVAKIVQMHGGVKCTRAAVWKWTQEQCNPNLASMAALAKAFECRIEDLLKKSANEVVSLAEETSGE